MMLVLPAEMSNVPFGKAEAETEIAEGILVEYSGKLLAFLLFTDAFKALSLSTLIVILFFPDTFVGFFGLSFSMGDYSIAPLIEVIFFVNLIKNSRCIQCGSNCPQGYHGEFENFPSS